MVFLITVVVLDQLVFEGISDSKSELVHSILKVHSELLDDKAFVVLINCDLSDQPVDLSVLCVCVHSAFLVEDGLLSVRAEVEVLVPVNEELRAPRGWHVQNIL